MKLRDLLATISNLVPTPTHPAMDAEITGISTNSHACKPGDLFIGMPGTRVDGGEFWESAIANGAIAVLISTSAAQKSPPLSKGNSEEMSCVISAEDMTAACAAVAAAFYGYPAQQMKMIGVTGTNGKTTTTHLIEFILTHAQLPTALFGTLYARWQGFEQTAVHTTPFPVELQQQLQLAVSAGCEFGVMEVSSHALAQGRVMGCPFVVSAFTNLTQDHLDYHRDMEDYFAAKALLFSPTYLHGKAIINADDLYGQRLISQLKPAQVWSYSVENLNSPTPHSPLPTPSVDLWLSELNYGATGVSGILHTPVGEASFELPLVGQYNLSNMLAAVGTVLHLGLSLDAVVAALPDFTGVPGRMERVQIKPDQDISVIVDYAHTPDSLENLLKASRPFIQGKMICVFGCGGDRDRTKRPKMGKIAAEGADIAVLTSDNPRTEDPEKILEDVLAGIDPAIKPMVICDRATAIRTAILQAQPGDGVLIAGKGHEDYQILGTEKIHFDDREEARDALAQRFGG